jgi:hypothetical protein
MYRCATHPTADLIADAIWVYDPTIGCKRAGELDAAHVVQTQMEMHVTGATHAYLGQWTLLKGTAVYKVHYSVEFMKAVSELLQVLFMEFVPQQINPEGIPFPAPGLPPWERARLSPQINSAREAVMDRLEDVVKAIDCMYHPGVCVPYTFTCLARHPSPHMCRSTRVVQ